MYHRLLEISTELLSARTSVQARVLGALKQHPVESRADRETLVNGTDISARSVHVCLWMFNIFTVFILW